jgi:hypothetical protein
MAPKRSHSVRAGSLRLVRPKIISVARALTDPDISDNPMHEWDFINQPRIYSDSDSTSNTDQSCHLERSDAHLDRVPLFEENLKLFNFATGVAITMASSDSTLTSTSSKAPSKSSAKSSTIKYNEKDYTSALQQRGCIWASPDVPNNYEDIMKAIEPSVQDELEEEDAWKVINGIKITPNELCLQVLVLPLVIEATQYIAPNSDFLLVFNIAWAKADPLERRFAALPSIAPPRPDLALALNQDTMSEIGILVSQEMGGCSRLVNGEPKLWCPFFRVEIKGWQGDSYAQLQNVHNAAMMVRNLRQVREKAGIDVEKDFDKKAHVLTLVFTKSGIELACGWSRVAKNGRLEYHYTILDEWRAPRDVQTATKMVIRIRRAIAWCSEHTKKMIIEDIEAIANKIEADQDAL